MKKVLMIIIIPYLVLIAVVFYIYFGPGLAGSYQSLKWKGIQTAVPEDFNVKTYESKGWEVYSLKKLTVLIKIARKAAFDVSGLHRSVGRLLYRVSPEPGTTFYVSNPRKTYEVVFAQEMDDVTLYFSVASPSVFSAAVIMDKITAHATYNGKKVTLPKHEIPLNAYITDFIFLGGMLLPLIIIVLIFYFSGRKPHSKYFKGDPIRFEESFVYFSSVRKFRRKNSFCYLVLTTTRLMVFQFGKPTWETVINRDKPDIRLEDKKIIIETGKEKIVLKPSEMEKWKEALRSFLY